MNTTHSVLKTVISHLLAKRDDVAVSLLSEELKRLRIEKTGLNKLQEKKQIQEALAIPEDGSFVKIAHETFTNLQRIVSTNKSLVDISLTSGHINSGADLADDVTGDVQRFIEQHLGVLGDLGDIDEIMAIDYTSVSVTQNGATVDLQLIPLDENHPHVDITLHVDFNSINSKDQATIDAYTNSAVHSSTHLVNALSSQIDGQDISMDQIDALTDETDLEIARLFAMHLLAKYGRTIN